ncbi:MAG TPA: choice-of-anchor tandem repeat GloVer-containing protein [Cyclobacteriaceae bacterium]|nr:choice-of-anchor tandem repeat GloVer-containing protein [Cyclobacteriaceae bacterium]
MRIQLALNAFLLALCITPAFGQQLWGTTVAGGDNNIGVIFKANLDGTALTVQKQFLLTTAIKEAFPENTGFLQASNGKLYGMVQAGIKNQGALFEYNPLTLTYTKLHDFGVTPSDGASSIGALTLAANGKIYGMTFQGGTNNNGTIFEYDIAASTYAKKYDFTSSSGSYPYGSLTSATNGMLYGFTTSGGAFGLGTIFEFNPGSATFTSKHDFNSAISGETPNGDLVQATNGKLYGLTLSGGATGDGTLIEFDPANGNVILKVSFNFLLTGSGPNGSLTQANNGKLYGMTTHGGANQLGTLFEYDPASGVLTKKIDFSGASNGSTPYGSLTNGSNGKLYGLTNQGGSTNKGVLFEFDPTTGILVKKVDLTGQANGSSPFFGAMCQATDGKFYGMIGAGGANNTGLIFDYNPTTNAFTNKMNFGSASDGSSPPGGLTLAPNGKLYGVTEKGGATNDGVIYEIDPGTSVFTRRASFESGVTGAVPIGQMINATNGKLYGLTYEGGSNNAGTIYEFDPTPGTITKKFDFNASSSGSSPYGSLVQIPNGKMYGLTASGGAAQAGTLFEFDPATGVFTKKIDLSTASGRLPQSTMVLVNDKLYGLTVSGGAGGYGVIFEFDPASSAFVKKVDFGASSSIGAPRGTLTLAANGKLYGVANVGGAFQSGGIFEYEPGTTSTTKKYDFGSTSGNFFSALGSMTKSSNNKLYGTTNMGGNNNLGTLFEFDPVTSSFTTKVDFNGTNGAQPWRGSLTLVSAVVTGDLVAPNTQRFVVFPNPANDVLRVHMENISGNKRVVIYSMTGHEIETKETSDNEISFNLSPHASGIYLIKLVGDKCYTERFVKH